MSLCTVLMGNEIWDLNDLTVSKTVLFLTTQFQTEQQEKNTNLWTRDLSFLTSDFNNTKHLKKYEFFLMCDPGGWWHTCSILITSVLLHSLMGFRWGGTFSLALSLLKLSPNQVVPNQSVPMQLRMQHSGVLGLWQADFTTGVVVAPLASVELGWRVSGPSLGCSPQPLWLLLLLENK